MSCPHQSLIDIEMRSIKTGNFRFLQQVLCLLLGGVCVVVVGGRGVCVCGGGGGVTSYIYIWHSTDVRAEWAPFSALPGI